jgi:hypothetical protein
MTSLNQQRVQDAARRLARNPDFEIFLTNEKQECIKDLMATSDDDVAGREVAYRRHKLADALMRKVKANG